MPKILGLLQVRSADKILELLNMGNSRRKTESTEVNATSSRYAIHSCQRRRVLIPEYLIFSLGFVFYVWLLTKVSFCFKKVFSLRPCFLMLKQRLFYWMPFKIASLDNLYSYDPSPSPPRKN